MSLRSYIFPLNIQGDLKNLSESTFEIVAQINNLSEKVLENIWIFRALYLYVFLWLLDPLDICWIQNVQRLFFIQN